MTSLRERIDLEHPIVQAGMGGGLSRHELAAAVSEAGGLGTVGFLDPRHLESELAAARERTARPLAVNLLLPFARRAHWEAAARADVVVTFWGTPRRRSAGVWIHQCGSVAEARAAERAGADGVIAQGVESGGHVRGRTPALELLASVREATSAGYPVLVAGGVADASGVREALDAGADAVVLGTRFLLSEESRAHPEYKRRLLEATDTLRTELFGVGWAGAHRVVANEATERWTGRDARGPRWVRLANRLAAPAVRALPAAGQHRLAAAQGTSLPFLAPLAPTDDAPSSTVDRRALYAGESVARIGDVRPAGTLVRELLP